MAKKNKNRKNDDVVNQPEHTQKAKQKSGQMSANTEDNCRNK